jgi:hypothetical protein
MEGDVKEVVGVLMRVLDGGNVSRGEVEDLAFEASGDLQTALNEAYIALLEFSYDCDAGRDKLDAEMRSRLEHLLNEIVRLADPTANDRGAN